MGGFQSMVTMDSTLLTSLGLGWTWLHCKSECECKWAACVKVSNNKFVTHMARVTIDKDLAMSFVCDDWDE